MTVRRLAAPAVLMPAARRYPPPSAAERCRPRVLPGSAPHLRDIRRQHRASDRSWSAMPRRAVRVPESRGSSPESTLPRIENEPGGECGNAGRDNRDGPGGLVEPVVPIGDEVQGEA